MLNFQWMWIIALRWKRVFALRRMSVCLAAKKSVCLAANISVCLAASISVCISVVHWQEESLLLFFPRLFEQRRFAAESRNLSFAAKIQNFLNPLEIITHKRSSLEVFLLSKTSNRIEKYAHTPNFSSLRSLWRRWGPFYISVIKQNS